MNHNRRKACVKISPTRTSSRWQKLLQMIGMYQIYLHSRVVRRSGNLCCPAWILQRTSKRPIPLRKDLYIVILLEARHLPGSKKRRALMDWSERACACGGCNTVYSNAKIMALADGRNIGEPSSQTCASIPRAYQMISGILL